MKHVHRFFVGQTLIAGEPVRLEGDDVFHAVRVLRLKAGDTVELADEAGRVFQAVVTDTGSKNRAALEAVPGSQAASVAVLSEKTPRLTVVQALPSGRKMDLIVEKLSEIGVERLVPVLTKKSVVRETQGKGEKMARWRRVAKAAAAQSKRTGVMAIDEPVGLAQWLADFDGAALVLSTEVEGRPLGNALWAVLGDRAADGVRIPALALIVGPEAGFSTEEINKMKGHGVCFASLGRPVMRTETAALVAATVVMHRLGVIG